MKHAFGLLTMSDGKQFYISCAQVKVTNGGNANPSPTALIPGAVKSTDPGYNINVSVSGPNMPKH